MEGPTKNTPELSTVVGSSIARETHSGSYIHAGPEIGVASTKAFTSQLTVLTMMAIQLGYLRGKMSEERFSELVKGMASLPFSRRPLMRRKRQ